MVADLLKQDGQIAGAVGFDVRDGEFYVFKAKATVVCAPGAGEALGFRAGAEIGGKEFLLAGIGPFSYIGHGDYVEKGAPKVSIEGKEVSLPRAGTAVRVQPATPTSMPKGTG